MRHIFAVLAFAVTLMLFSIEAMADSEFCKSQITVNGEHKDRKPDNNGIYQPQCSPYAVGSYPGNQCYITIDRETPVSPQSIIVPQRTSVCIVLANPRPTESVQFLPSFANIAAPDVAGAVFQNLTPLQSIGIGAGLVPKAPVLAFWAGLTQQQQFAKLLSAEREWVYEQLMYALSSKIQADREKAAISPTAKPSDETKLQSYKAELEADGRAQQMFDGIDLNKLLSDKPETEIEKILSNDVLTKLAGPVLGRAMLLHDFASLSSDQRRVLIFDLIADAQQVSAVHTKAANNAGGDAKQAGTDKVKANDADNAVKILTENYVSLFAGSLDERQMNDLIDQLPTSWQTKLTEGVNNVNSVVISKARLLIANKMRDVEIQLSSAQKTIAKATAAATCFIQYNGVTDSLGTYKLANGPQSDSPKLCKTDSIKTSSIETDPLLKKDLDDMYDIISIAATVAPKRSGDTSFTSLAQGETAELDVLIPDALTQCSSGDEISIATEHGAAASADSTAKSSRILSLNAPGDCDEIRALKRRLVAAETLQTNLANAQANLQQVKLQMEMLVKMPTLFYFIPTRGEHQKGYTSGTVSIVTQPLIAANTTPTTTTVATIPITFGTKRWLTFTASTGTAFMLGQAASYSVQQQPTAASNTKTTGSLCSGVATSTTSTTNGSGTSTSTTSPASTYCVANSPSSSPQVLVPVVYAHYLLGGVKQSPFRIGLHLTGGVGLNVTAATKSATFLVGPSVQLGSVMITPALSFFEDQRLKGNFNSSQLYTTSGSVPTDLAWVRKISFGISYIIPSLSSASSASPSSSPSSSSTSSGSSSNLGGSGGGGSSPKKGH